jgi:hypothetical protein
MLYGHEVLSRLFMAFSVYFFSLSSTVIVENIGIRSAHSGPAECVMIIATDMAAQLPIQIARFVKTIPFISSSNKNRAFYSSGIQFLPLFTYG